MEWSKQRVLVTGGASFIGSHLVDGLLARGASVRVVDDLSSGRLANLAGREVEFIQGDLRDQSLTQNAVRGMDVVFHLAAAHGGRGYVDLHQAATAHNLLLDGLVFKACLDFEVEQVVFASSGCVYPNFIQQNTEEILYLTEDKVGPPYDADNLYGWAKLMGEMTLQAYAREYGLKTASCRYFTVYGERGIENHAVMAMIARAFIRQNPFEVWGTGEQIRNWTHVSDIVRGTILAAEHLHDGTAVNLGTMERTRVIDAVREILRYTDQSETDIKFLLDMPTGPLNRVADNRLAQKLLGWSPQVAFMAGLQQTIDWYFANHDPDEVRADFARKLTER